MTDWRFSPTGLVVTQPAPLPERQHSHIGEPAPRPFSPPLSGPRQVRRGQQFCSVSKIICLHPPCVWKFCLSHTHPVFDNLVPSNEGDECYILTSPLTVYSRFHCREQGPKPKQRRHMHHVHTVGDSFVPGRQPSKNDLPSENLWRTRVASADQRSAWAAA